MLITCGSWKLVTNSPTVFLTCLIPLLIFLYLLTIFVVAINLIFKGKTTFQLLPAFWKGLCNSLCSNSQRFLALYLANKLSKFANIQPFTPSHWYTYSPYCSLCIYQGADEENLFNNQKLLLGIISFNLVTLIWFRDDIVKKG